MFNLDILNNDDVVFLCHPIFRSKSDEYWAAELFDSQN